MDSLWSYTPRAQKKHISSWEIQRMKKAMKKVPVLQLQSDIYHTQEVNEAENMLGWLIEKNSNDELSLLPSWIPWAHNRWQRLMVYFTSLFTK